MVDLIWGDNPELRAKAEEERAKFKSNGHDHGADWPDPEPLIAPAEAERPYPLAALPAIIGDAVAEYHTYGQQPIPLIACSALASASLVVQGLADVARDDNLIGPVSLYLTVVACSGERKTSADREFNRPIREWMIERRDELAPAAAVASAAVAAWEAERDGLLAKIKSASGKRSERDEADIAALRERLAALERNRPAEKILPSLFYEDTNPAALAVDLAEGWPSASLWSDEAGLIVGSHGMSDESLMRFVGLLNRLWDGNSFERRRRTTKSAIVKGRRFTASLMMQPVVLARLLSASNGASRGMGMIARCLTAWPASTIGERLYRPIATGRPALARLHRGLRELLDTPLPTATSDMALSPPALRLSPRAFQVWREFHDEIEQTLSRSGEFGSIPDIGAKIAENAARLSAVFHIIAAGPRDEIAETEMAAAARVAAWHLTEARRTIGATEKPLAVADAELLLEWLLRQPHDDPIEPRRISQFGPVPLRDRERRDGAIAYLIGKSCVREHRAGQAIVLVINPKLSGSFG
jgi:hypothetical protein